MRSDLIKPKKGGGSKKDKDVRGRRRKEKGVLI